MATAILAEAFHTSFYIGILKPLYRDYLPTEPKLFRDLKGHLFEKEFREAI